MEKFTVHTGRVLPLRRSDVDTDQIIPAVWLKKVTRTGFGAGLFETWRADPEFVLHRPEHSGATILVGGPNFGTGSSREHAVWALQDHGFRAVISAKFADIFRGNAAKGGLLTVELPQDAVEELWQLVEDSPDTPVTVDLETRSITAGEWRREFDIDDYTRWRLLEGLDDIGLTMRHIDAIDSFELRRPDWHPTTVPTG
ncbi:MAG TPA: 3-isopropylmalate dehydratase small subunit [Actinomycetes bacterium]|jgi:3-isopropylmalate/(R)-2-methylmalate dehydratase small subunit|nr:3-isopropylmalate dehydratase small subunit [Actinomycetes bacterium]